MEMLEKNINWNCFNYKGNKHLVDFIDLFIDNSNLNYTEVSKYRLINKEINNIISNRIINFINLKKKIFNGNEKSNCFKYHFKFELDSLIRLLSYRPYKISNILADIIHSIFQNKEFDKELLNKSNKFIYGELYMEVIEICNRIINNIAELTLELEKKKENYKNYSYQRELKIQQFLEKGKHEYVYQEVVSDSLELNEIEEICNELTYIKKFVF